MEGRRRLFSRYRLRTLLCATVLLWLAIPVHGAQQARIGVIISGDAFYFTLAYQQMVERVHIRLPDTEFVLLTPSSLRTQTDSHDLDLLVAIGTEATRLAMEHPLATPLLATFVTEEAFRHQLDNTNARASGRQVSAVFLDQPPIHRVRLARALVPRGQVLGSALGPIASLEDDLLASAARQSGFELITATIDLTSNPDRELTPVFRKADVFVVIPDSARLNQAASRWILNQGYRNRVPVVGFSRSYTRAGALASLYTAPEDIGRHTGETIAAWLCCGSNDLWIPRHSRYFTIDTNSSVGHALGIRLPSEAELYRAVLDYTLTP